MVVSVVELSLYRRYEDDQRNIPAVVQEWTGARDMAVDGVELRRSRRQYSNWHLPDLIWSLSSGTYTRFDGAILGNNGNLGRDTGGS